MPPKKQDHDQKRPTTPKDRSQLEKDRERKKNERWVPPHVKSGLLISSIFDAMNFQYVSEML